MLRTTAHHKLRTVDLRLSDDLEHRGGAGHNTFHAGARRKRTRGIIVTTAFGVCVCFALVFAMSALSSDGEYAFDTFARPVNPLRYSDARYVESAVKRLLLQFQTLEHADAICLSCPYVGVALQCIVWPNGTVWLNPEVAARLGTIVGMESRFGAAQGDTLVMATRAKEIVVHHSYGAIATVTDGEAACVEYMIDLFAGKLHREDGLGKGVAHGD